jgi:hypothetical protein
VRYSSDNVEPETIFSRIESGYYQSPDILLADVHTAATSVIESLQSGEHVLRDADSTTRAINQVTLLKQSLSKVCRHLVEADAKVKEQNGVEGRALLGSAVEMQRPAVLTLTSQTDRGPKQLYSGLQTKRKDGVEDTSNDSINQKKEFPTLDPGKFPNGITTTLVPPSNTPNLPNLAKQKRVFGEVFRPHRSLKALEPPRPSRNATRGSSLGWVNHEELAGSERPTPAYKSDYRYASLPTGSWLHYNSAEASAASAPDSKRRQKDRALSFGESRAEAADEIAENEQARAKALFQSAYSSFAPSIDNSAAVVPEKVRSQIWWNKFGQKRFQALLSSQYPDVGLKGRDCTSDTAEQPVGDFAAVIEAFEDSSAQDPLQDHDKDADPKEVDEVLQEISDLLQTLSSYQRIRNLSKMNSGPATPTSTEVDVYEMLKSNLAILVSSLPPYAVAKLGGDQLEMLNVSTNIVVDMKDHVGTMEQDEYSMQRQRVVMPATHASTVRSSVSVGTAGRPGNYSTQPANFNQRLHYANAPRTPYVNQSRAMPAYVNTVTPQSQAYASARAAQLPTHRPGLSAPPRYPTQTYSPTPSIAQFQRPSNTLQNGFGPSYAQSVNAQAYAQQRQTQASFSYPLSQSPQKPIQSTQPVVHAQQVYGQAQQVRQNQASPAVPFSVNNQTVMTDQARSQLQAQRQISGTPQAPNLNVNGQYSQMVRGSTPGGGTPNGRPMVVAGSGQ